MKNIRASVVIVSHNNKGILPRNLDALKKQSYKNFDVFIVDNDSNDGTEEFIRKNYPEINFVSLSAGVSEKRNFAIKNSKAEYIITLDSDAVMTKDWVKRAVEYMDEHKNVGICCGKLIGMNGLIDYAGSITALTGGVGDIGHGDTNKQEYNCFRRISAMTTAGAIIRKKMIEDIGGFDEDYYYGYEDADIGLRANFAGWIVVYNPDLVATHRYHGTVSKFSKKRSDYFEYEMRRNRIITLLKNFEFRTLLLNSPVTAASLIYELKSSFFPTLKAYFSVLFDFKKILEKRKKNFEKKRVRDRELFDAVSFPATVSRFEKPGIFQWFFKRMRASHIRNLVFFITAKCNSKCKHCFYWKSLNKQKDLSLKEIAKILSKFYDVYSLSLSGGEPFLRQDLYEIIKLAIKYNNVKVIDIPTNCLIDISDKLEKILKENPNTRFAIVCSLDGLKEEHEFIRGVKGSFDKTIKLIYKLGKLRKKYNNFASLSVNTVVTNKNLPNMHKFTGFVKKLPVTGHTFDIIRGEHQNILMPPTAEQIRKFNKLRYNIIKYYNRKKPVIKRIFYNLKEKEIIKIQFNLLKKKKWPFKCTAGKTDIVIESDGSARICELHPKIGSLLENSPEELLKTEKAWNIFKQIANHSCDCTHICYLCSSMDCSFRNVFFDRFVNFNLD